MQPEGANTDLELTVYGEECLLRWIQIQNPLELGDCVLIVPHESEPHSWKHAFVIRASRNRYSLLTVPRGEIIWRTDHYLWAITNEQDEYTSGLEVFEFPRGYEPPDSYQPPPTQPGVAQLYYDRENETDIVD